MFVNNNCNLSARALFPLDKLEEKKNDPAYRRGKLALQTISILLGNSRKANIHTKRRRDRECNDNVYHIDDRGRETYSVSSIV